MDDIVEAIDRVLRENDTPHHAQCPRDILQYAKEEILRLRSLAGPVAASPTASEIYHGLRHPRPES